MIGSLTKTVRPSASLEKTPKVKIEGKHKSWGGDVKDAERIGLTSHHGWLNTLKLQIGKKKV